MADDSKIDLYDVTEVREPVRKGTLTQGGGPIGFYGETTLLSSCRNFSVFSLATGEASMREVFGDHEHESICTLLGVVGSTAVLRTHGGALFMDGSNPEQWAPIAFVELAHDISSLVQGTEVPTLLDWSRGLIEIGIDGRDVRVLHRAQLCLPNRRAFEPHPCDAIVIDGSLWVLTWDGVHHFERVDQ